MRSVTNGAKELLPVRDKSVLEWVAREAADAGCDETIVVTAPGKSDIDAAATALGLRLVVQAEPRGLADAVLIAACLQPVLILLPDTLYFPSNPSSRLVAALSRGYDFAVAVERIPDHLVQRYGIVEWNPENGRIAAILEKPQPAETASRWAVAARFALGPRTLDFVRRHYPANAEGEVQLTPLLDASLAAGHVGLAIPLEDEERRYDCGSPEGYRQALEVLRESV